MVSYLRSRLVDTGMDCVPYEMLSDEELAAIDGGHESAFLVRPWIEAQDDVDARVAARFGQRSLLLRGLLEVRTGVDEPSVEVSDELQFLADSRRDCVAYVSARTSRRGERRARNYALQEDIGAFEEEADAEGFHLFSACTYAAAVRRLAAWALPGVDHRGPEVRTRVPRRRWGAWAVNEFGTEATLGRIDLFLGGADDPGETWLLAQAHGAGVLGFVDGDKVRVTSTTIARLESRLTDRIARGLGVVLSMPVPGDQH